ncbi:MAG: 30S ribosomal protein S4e [Candidatus Bathyarchaeota archaeon]|nr:30S ribosomal protein S4e [Candidatus Bathyarchaeota archaeon]
MGRKGKTARLKRKPAPRFWPIHRKEDLWVVKPSAGPHGLENCLPLSLVLRDILGIAETRREAQIEIHQRKVLVDGHVQKDDFPVGLMDVISIADADKYYRVIPSHKGLSLSPISKEETRFKFCRVENKTTVPEGMQLNLHDGSNLLIKVADPKNPKEETYNTFDVLKVSLPSKEIAECVPLKEGNLAVITGGKNIGVKGKIVEIEKTVAKKRKNALVVVEDEKGRRFQTILDFVFSLGQNQPLASTEEVAAVV